VLSRASASSEKIAIAVQDPVLSDLNMGEFDFEHSISGGHFLNADISSASMLPSMWDAGTEAWLDHILRATPDLDFQELNQLL
jgi:hypothetical protein